MKNPNDVFLNMISNYSYGGAQDLLVDYGHADKDICKVLRTFKHALNFDFDYAMDVLQTSSAEFKHETMYKEIRTSLKDLIGGKATSVFSELMFSMMTQINRDEYIDFLGRLYRYREALMKYLFLRVEGARDINMMSTSMSKRYQLKILKEKYGIHNYNLGIALTRFFHERCQGDYAVSRLMGILDTDKMLKLMSIRNDSIIGHGFAGVSRQDIERAYGGIDEILYDFKRCVGYVGLDLEYDKYDKWNNVVIMMLKDLGGI